MLIRGTHGELEPPTNHTSPTTNAQHNTAFPTSQSISHLQTTNPNTSPLDSQNGQYSLIQQLWRQVDQRRRLCNKTCCTKSLLPACFQASLGVADRECTCHHWLRVGLSGCPEMTANCRRLGPHGWSIWRWIYMLAGVVVGDLCLPLEELGLELVKTLVLVLLHLQWLLCAGHSHLLRMHNGPYSLLPQRVGECGVENTRTEHQNFNERMIANIRSSSLLQPSPRTKVHNSILSTRNEETLLACSYYPTCICRIHEVLLTLPITIEKIIMTTMRRSD